MPTRTTRPRRAAWAAMRLGHRPLARRVQLRQIAHLQEQPLALGLDPRGEGVAHVGQRRGGGLGVRGRGGDHPQLVRAQQAAGRRPGLADQLPRHHARPDGRCACTPAPAPARPAFRPAPPVRPGARGCGATPPAAADRARRRRRCASNRPAPSKRVKARAARSSWTRPSSAIRSTLVPVSLHPGVRRRPAAPDRPARRAGTAPGRCSTATAAALITPCSGRGLTTSSTVPGAPTSRRKRSQAALGTAGATSPKSSATSPNPPAATMASAAASARREGRRSCGPPRLIRWSDHNYVPTGVAREGPQPAAPSRGRTFPPDPPRRPSPRAATLLPARPAAPRSFPDPAPPTTHSPPRVANPRPAPDPAPPSPSPAAHASPALPAPARAPDAPPTLRAKPPWTPKDRYLNLCSGSSGPNTDHLMCPETPRNFRIALPDRAVNPLRVPHQLGMQAPQTVKSGLRSWVQVRPAAQSLSDSLQTGRHTAAVPAAAHAHADQPGLAVRQLVAVGAFLGHPPRTRTVAGDQVAGEEEAALAGGAAAGHAGPRIAGLRAEAEAARLGPTGERPVAAAAPALAVAPAVPHAGAAAASAQALRPRLAVGVVAAALAGLARARRRAQRGRFGAEAAHVAGAPGAAGGGAGRLAHRSRIAQAVGPGPGVPIVVGRGLRAAHHRPPSCARCAPDRSAVPAPRTPATGPGRPAAGPPPGWCPSARWRS